MVNLFLGYIIFTGIGAICLNSASKMFGPVLDLMFKDETKGNPSLFHYFNTLLFKPFTTLSLVLAVPFVKIIFFFEKDLKDYIINEAIEVIDNEIHYTPSKEDYLEYKERKKAEKND